MAALSPCLQFGPLDSISLVVLFLGFSGAALFSSLDLLIRIFYTFKKNNTYFYALLVATAGIFIYQTSILVLILTHVNTYIVLTFVNIGWVCMVTGQSLVMWSRLHLIITNTRTLNWILAVILLNGLVFHGVETVFSYRSVPNGLNAYPPFSISEKVSLIVFSIQECLISCLYIFKTWKLLKSGSIVWGNNTRKVMVELIAANFFVIALDITTFFLEIFGYWGVWCSFKGLAYSAKIKVEFHVLNQLRNLAKHTRDDETTLGGADSNIRTDLNGVRYRLNRNDQSKSKQPLPSVRAATDHQALAAPQPMTNHRIRTVLHVVPEPTMQIHHTAHDSDANSSEPTETDGESNS